jgi:hypothetical protein
MEFRWLTTEEQRERAVESGSLSEVLALAQKLQAEGEGLVTDDQVIEMGRELGIRTEYVREALRLRQRAAHPTTATRVEPDHGSLTPQPMALAVHAALLGIGMGTLPLALTALSQSNNGPVALFLLMASLAAGWSARASRLAGVAGALAAPAVILAAAFFTHSDSWHGPGLGREAFFLSLLSFPPLCAAAGRAAAKVRRWTERLAERSPLTASGH